MSARLSDGTSIDELVPKAGARSLGARVLSDPEIYRMELERIFDKTWVFVAHESEIPKPNDFVARFIGEDPVLVSRDADGGIAVVLNSCSHRGALVCHADRGSAATFRCPYHGWIYENTGELLGIFGEKSIYFGKNKVDKSQLGLKRARVGVYQGLVFATWEESAGTLEEHLGPMREHLDAVFGLTKGGMEVIGPPHRWVIPVNWKLGADNFSTDNYHTSVVHETMADAVPGIQMDPASTVTRVTNYTDPKRGHSAAGFIELDASVPKPAHVDIAAQIGGVAPNLVQELRESLTERQVELFVKTSAGAGNVWPNLSWIRSGFLSSKDEPPYAAVSLRLWQPKGPDKMEAYSWTLVHRDAPPEFKAAAARSMLRAFGPSGNFEQDDAEVWGSIQKGTSGVQGRRRRLLYNVEGTLDPSSSEQVQVFNHQITDDNHWHFYARWRDVLNGGGL